MFGDYSLGDLGSIFAMQAFAGLILFSVYLLMALGLAIIFGQMGVINMAHGEFMTLGAYMTYLCSNLCQTLPPALFPVYFFVAMVLAFFVSGALGLLVEWALIRHLYAAARHAARHLGPQPDPAAGLPLDLRRPRGRRRAADWLMGSLQVTEHRDSDQRPVRHGPDR